MAVLTNEDISLIVYMVEEYLDNMKVTDNDLRKIEKKGRDLLHRLFYIEEMSEDGLTYITEE